MIKLINGVKVEAKTGAHCATDVSRLNEPALETFGSSRGNCRNRSLGVINKLL